MVYVRISNAGGTEKDHGLMWALAFSASTK